MNATLLYRIAAVLLLVFTAVHALGFMGFKPSSVEGLAMRDAMNSVWFEFKGTNYSYGGFYRGFVLTVTAYLLSSAFLAWAHGLERHFKAVGAISACRSNFGITDGVQTRWSGCSCTGRHKRSRSP